MKTLGKLITALAVLFVFISVLRMMHSLFVSTDFTIANLVYYVIVCGFEAMLFVFAGLLTYESLFKK